MPLTSRTSCARSILLFLSTLSLSTALAGSSGDPFDRTRAGQAWQRVTPTFLEQYVGNNRSQLPALLRRAERLLRETCQQAEYDPGVCDEMLVSSFLSDVVRGLDDGHTALVPMANRVEWGEATDSGFFGQASGQGMVVTSVTPGTSAEQIGLQSGDLLNYQDYWQLAAGEFKSGVLRVQRRGEPLELNVTAPLTLTRSLPNLQVTGEVGVLRIPTFQHPGVAQRVHDLVHEANQQGLRSLVVDVRWNSGGGGCFNAASAFVQRFRVQHRIGQNTFVREFKNGQMHVVRATAPLPNLLHEEQVLRPTSFEGRLAILANYRSASCAEMFTSTLQEAGRAKVYGQATRGIGDTGTAFLPVNQAYALLFAGQKLLLASGKPYPSRVQPDVTVHDDVLTWSRTGRDAVLDRALVDLAKP